MSTTERILLAMCVFAGFLWIRGRARSMDLSRRQGTVVLGVFVLLPAWLVGGKWLVETLGIGGYTGMLLKALLIAAGFAAVGLLVIKPSPPPDGGAAEGNGSPPASP